MASRSPGKAGALAQAEQLHATSTTAWRRWLTRHANRTAGVWLVTWKKPTGKPRMEYAEAVEEMARLAAKNVRAKQWRA